MQFSIISLFLLALTVHAAAQNDTSTNSFESFYKQSNSAVHYQFDKEKQIHNYSNNWDFDKDSISDQVYFLGTGGAHLYYFLRVILSSDNIKRDFANIASDFPVLPIDYNLKSIDHKLDIKQTFFTVFNDEKSNNLAIFIKLDKATYSANSEILKAKNILTNLVTIFFKNGESILKDFDDTNRH